MAERHKHQWTFARCKAKCSLCNAEVASNLFLESKNPELLELMSKHASELRSKEWVRQYGKEYRQVNKGGLAAYHQQRDQQYYQSNKESVHERVRRYHLTHRDSRLEHFHQYHLNNRERLLQYHRRYSKEHPELGRQYQRRRRASVVGSDGHFTGEEFKVLCEAFENKCVYCEQILPLVTDHATPLSRGGSDNICNIVPACSACNLKKRSKTFEEFIAQLVGEKWNAT